jgi:HEAT repeat protein
LDVFQLARTIRSKDAGAFEKVSFLASRIREHRGAELEAASIARLLNDDDPHVRLLTVHALAELSESRSAVVALTQLLYQPSSSVVVPMERFVEIGSGPPRLQVFRVSDNDCKRVAAMALTEARGHSDVIIPALVAAVRDHGHSVSGSAMVALQRIGATGDELIEALGDVVEDPSFDADSRHRAARFLGDLGPAAASQVAALMRALEAREDAVQEAAIEALGKQGTSAKAAVPALLKLASGPFPTLQWRARTALKQIDPEAIAEAGSDE